MCGIAGYVGTQEAAPIMLRLLKSVEYRGYDSAGMATVPNDGGPIQLCRTQGKLTRLEAVLAHMPPEGTIGIAHTRWATHGLATQENAHPHLAGSVAVVHNGIIENFQELRLELKGKGRVIVSETDTEVVPHLIDQYLQEGLDYLSATREAVARLTGSFALGILFAGRKDFLIAVRKGSPLVIGFGRGESFIGSDELSLAAIADRVVFLEEGDLAVLTKIGATIYDATGASVKRDIRPLVAESAKADKGIFKHFTLKEICEQPDTTGNTYRSFADPATHRIEFPQLPFDFRDVSRILMIGCGTSYHAGLIAKHWFESLARIPVDCDFASEAQYRDRAFLESELGIFISQSGETADTRHALQRMRTEGHCKTLGIVNVEHSAISREADAAIYTKAYPEIAVASTKGFTADLVVLGGLAAYAGRVKGLLGSEREKQITKAFDELPAKIQKVLALEGEIEAIAKLLAFQRSVFYLGRGTSYPVALEGALKLKELGYIHAEGFGSGEWKHGPLALVEDGVPAIVVAPRDGVWFGKTLSNLEEIRSREGEIILFSDRSACESYSGKVLGAIAIPEADPMTAPILYSVALQLLAYHVAVLKGNDVDQPRNLAKSVTVE